MSQFPIRFHPATVEEAGAAVDWYAKFSPGIAGRFILDLEQALGSVEEDPDQWPLFDEPVQRVQLLRFPYALIFRVFENCIEVLALAHGRRRPGYWKNRTG